ncbi:hypothetical protein C2845_PM07G13530 [Panicum miliaceum]|uniref:F-box domain-containing protein n=1 Tax=Panicum miliaceum TaxID=4540 RepID=A0A3L6SHQ5_PANMI|nr:hypothetical protein C2845_PM07G13530 [Panicum miliaceum]
MEGSNDWASLPWLILEGVASHLTEPKDFVRIRSVCPKWRDAIRLTAHGLFQPWIMIKEGAGDGDSGSVLFHSVPALRGKIIIGSGAGLLIGIDRYDDLSIVLVNPLTGESTALPRLPDCFQFHGCGHTSGFATDHEVNGEVDVVVVVVLVWAPGLGPTAALWRLGSEDGWATTHDANAERFWALLPRHRDRLVTHGPQVLESELAAAAAAEKDLANSSTELLPGRNGAYLIEHEGKVCFLFENYYGQYNYNPEMPAEARVIFALNDVGDGLVIVDWADAQELRDKAIFQGVDGACYVIPASDDRGLSKNAVYYFDWRHMGLEDEAEDDADDWGGWAFCLCKWDIVESVDTIVKHIPNPAPVAWAITTWFVPSFKACPA